MKTKLPNWAYPGFKHVKGKTAERTIEFIFSDAANMTPEKALCMQALYEDIIRTGDGRTQIPEDKKTEIPLKILRRLERAASDAAVFEAMPNLSLIPNRANEGRKYTEMFQDFMRTNCERYGPEEEKILREFVPYHLALTEEVERLRMLFDGFTHAPKEYKKHGLEGAIGVLEEALKRLDIEISYTALQKGPEMIQYAVSGEEFLEMINQVSDCREGVKRVRKEFAKLRVERAKSLAQVSETSAIGYIRVVPQYLLALEATVTGEQSFKVDLRDFPKLVKADTAVYMGLIREFKPELPVEEPIVIDTRQRVIIDTKEPQVQVNYKRQHIEKPVEYGMHSIVSDINFFREQAPYGVQCLARRFAEDCLTNGRTSEAEKQAISRVYKKSQWNHPGITYDEALAILKPVYEAVYAENFGRQRTLITVERVERLIAPHMKKSRAKQAQYEAAAAC